MSDPDGLLTFAYRGCVFAIPEGLAAPKKGSLFFCRNVAVVPGERVLEIGGGLGLAAVLMARAGARVVATDVVPEAVEAIGANARRNGVDVDVRRGDAYAPVAGERFDLICTNPPQMPTPPGRERTDATALADNGGVDGWALLDRIIAGAPTHLAPGGRLLFTIFGFLGRRAAFARLEARGLAPSIIATETQSFPRIGYERLEHIRSVDTEGTLAGVDLPRTVERLLVEGRAR